MVLFKNRDKTRHEARIWKKNAAFTDEEGGAWKGIEPKTLGAEGPAAEEDGPLAVGETALSEDDEVIFPPATKTWTFWDFSQ